MGCTSSGPKSITSHGNATDSNIQFLEEVEIIKEPIKGKKVESKGVQVLPKCDNMKDNKINSYNQAALERPMKKDSTVDRESQTCDDLESHAESTDSTKEEKLTSLEEVVDKVVEQIHKSDDSLNCLEKVQKDMNLEGFKNDNFNQELSNIIETESSEVQNKEDDKMEKELEEVASPSQSESSRATRWEALADIAAELPPSLAVDPVTGQIYALSK